MFRSVNDAPPLCSLFSLSQNGVSKTRSTLVAEKYAMVLRASLFSVLKGGLK